MGHLVHQHRYGPVAARWQCVAQCRSACKYAAEGAAAAAYGAYSCVAAAPGTA